MVPCNSKECYVIWSQTDEVSISLAGYYSDFIFLKKKDRCSCNNEIDILLGEEKCTLAHFLQNCELKIIKTYGKIG